jgi:hypothetical protein
MLLTHTFVRLKSEIMLSRYTMLGVVWRYMVQREICMPASSSTVGTLFLEGMCDQ